MSLNTNIVSGIDPINKQPMIDPIGQNSPLPLDIARIIFQNLKADLPFLALACRNWKIFVDDKNFRELIRPAQAFGSREWKEYIKVDAGEESSLPRRVYGYLEKYNGLLTFIPEKIKATKEESSEIEEISLDNLEAVGKLIQKINTGLKTIFDSDSWKKPIREKRKLEKPHWVWIEKEIIGRNKTYLEQRVLAKSNSKKIPGAHIPGLIDTAVSVLVEYVKARDCFFINNTVGNGRWTFIRVNETTDEGRIQLGFSPRFGIMIFSTAWFFSEFHNDIGFAIARKFF
jgi:hypothetical protein